MYANLKSLFVNILVFHVFETFFTNREQLEFRSLEWNYKEIVMKLNKSKRAAILVIILLHRAEKYTIF